MYITKEARMATEQEVADEYDVSLEQVKLLKTAMSRTWGQVCYDYTDCFEGGEAEMLAAFDNNEAAMIAEATIDADRVITFCPEWDLKWVYNLDDGSWRSNCMKMAEAVWTADQVRS
jgi:hypothetical protein